MAETDEFGHHEVLHTAHIFNCMWSDHIVDHAAVASNPELKAQADRISETLYDFYAAVSGVIVEKFGRNMDESIQKE